LFRWLQAMPCGPRRIGWQARGIAAESDDHVEEPAPQEPRDDERIPSVVARAREDQCARRAFRQQVARDRRGGEPGALHQRCRGVRGLDGTDLRDAKDRLETHAAIIGGTAGVDIRGVTGYTRATAGSSDAAGGAVVLHIVGIQFREVS
jgi:hypothetical protein